MISPWRKLGEMEEEDEESEEKLGGNVSVSAFSPSLCFLPRVMVRVGKRIGCCAVASGVVTRGLQGRCDQSQRGVDSGEPMTVKMGYRL